MSFNLAQSDFRGGEWSPSALGNFMDPKYKTSLSVSVNGYPITPGAWMRRQGTMHDGFTRRGGPGRGFTYEFEDATPYTVELTNGYLRFWASNGEGLVWATTNDSVNVSAISTATPAEVTLANEPVGDAPAGSPPPHEWPTGCTVFFSGLGGNNPLLQNRAFIWTNVDGTHGTLTDELTGASIDGSTLGSFVSGTLNRIQEVPVPIIGTLATFNNVRSVQTEEAAVLLGAGVAPQGLYVANPLGPYNQFSSNAVTFLDGPYLDPPGNTAVPSAAPGTYLVPNATSGAIQLTIQFQQYASTTTYQEDEYVTASSVNYVSLVNNNLGNTPSSSPSDWAAVTIATGAINDGAGFTALDIGRLIRLQSEPAFWAAGSTYATGAVVSYNPNNLPGQTTYWTSLVSSNTGNIPGVDIIHWQLIPPGATGTGSAAPFIWTWGQIVSLQTTVPPAPSGIAQIGNMSSNGGLSAAFNGNSDQNAASSAAKLGSLTTINWNSSANFTGWVGQNYTGASPADYAISSVTITPSSDQGFIQLAHNSAYVDFSFELYAVLYGANSAPANETAGTVLGSTVIQSGSLGPGSITPTYYYNLGTSPATIVSGDTSTAYGYVWVRLILIVNTGSPGGRVPANEIMTVNLYVGQMELVLASGSGVTGNGVTIELMGPNLLYSQQIRSWRLGLFSGETGYPTCGTYSDGRIWLAGVLGNHFDTSCSNGIEVNSSGVTINMAPTDPYGNVLASNAISETFNTPGANPIFWMEPDQQGILCGTQAGEHLVYAPAAGGFAPNNIAEKRVTKIRCAPILPARCEHTVAFVQTHTRTLVEFFPDVFSGKFTAPHLSEKWDHLTVSGIAEIAYQQELAPIIWARTNAGALIGATYKRDTLMTSQGPTFIGAHHHPLGSGNSVVSICTGPSEGGTLDALSMVTFDGAYYHVETLTDMFEDADTISQAWFLDNAIVPSSYSLGYTLGGANAVVINGLWHLNGKTVTVFAGTLDCGDWPVSNGSVTVPVYPNSAQANTAFTEAFVSAYSGAMPIIVGFTYTSQGQLHRPIEPQETGSPIGPTLGQRRTVKRFAAYMVNTQGISFGTSFSNLHAFTFKSNGNIPYASNQLFTGVGYRDSLADSWSYDGMICWQISRPWPACIGAIEGEINGGRD
jgi:hypothetical protein